MAPGRAGQGLLQRERNGTTDPEPPLGLHNGAPESGPSFGVLALPENDRTRSVWRRPDVLDIIAPDDGGHVPCVAESSQVGMALRMSEWYKRPRQGSGVTGEVQMIRSRAISRRSILALGAARPWRLASAQTAPRQPIRLLVAFPAGGVTDIAVRAFAGPLGEALGSPVVVDNRPGADGIIAAELAAKAPPDGSVLFATAAGPLNYVPAVRKVLPYDPARDFTPIARIGEVGFFLYVNSGLPVTSVAELVLYAKQQPNGLTHATATPASLLTSTVFANAEGIQLLQVPYKGDAQVAPDLVSGRVQLAFAAGAHLPMVHKGALRVLMTTLPARSPLLPEVPTWQEIGLAALPMKSWLGLVGPAHLPSAVVDRISQALRTALGISEVRDSLAKLAVQVDYANSAEFALIVKAQMIAWADAARLAGLKQE